MTDDLNEVNENVNTSSSDGFDVEQTRPQPYANDPLYRDLLHYYQNGDWEKSQESVDHLLDEYPEDPGLLQFQHEIEMRTTLHHLGEESEKAERRQKVKKTTVNLLIAVGVFAVILMAGLWGYNQYRNSVEQAEFEREQAILAAQLEADYENALNYLQAGKADQALELLNKIEAIDPNYAEVRDNIERANELIAIEDIYLEAKAKYQQGDLDGAKVMFQQIVDQEGIYKDASLLLQDINNTIEINGLKVVVKEAYGQQDWAKVIDTYENILDVDATADIDDLKVELFFSFMYRVIEIADKPDVTLDEVEQATEYYREALAIFPQSKEYEQERAELQRVAVNLLANEFYIAALDLVESQNYSIQAAEEALSLLRKASNIGSGSPAIADEINLLQLYLTALNNFNNRRWDDAITALEELNRDEPSYADGMVQYLLYESYLGQGDTLLNYAEYTDARAVYELAETFAWGDSGNNLRLFQVEIRVGYALRRLSLTEQAAEFFRFAANQVNFGQKLTSEYPDTLEAYNDAVAAMNSGDFWNAARLYEIAFENLDPMYEYKTITVGRGDILAQIAFREGSTIGAILSINEGLGDSLVVRSQQEIMVPYLIEDQN